MKNRDYTVLIRIALIIGVIYFASQSNFFGLLGKDKEEGLDAESNIKTEAEAGTLAVKETPKIVETAPKSVLPILLEEPTLYKEEFLLLLKVYNEAWFNMDLDVKLYDEIQSKEKVQESLNWLMEKREDNLEVPLELTLAVRKYIDENEKETEKVAGIFAGKRLLGIVRQYDEGNWSISLKNISAYKNINGPAGNAPDAELEKKSEFKVVGVD